MDKVASRRFLRLDFWKEENRSLHSGLHFSRLQATDCEANNQVSPFTDHHLLTLLWIDEGK